MKSIVVYIFILAALFSCFGNKTKRDESADPDTLALNKPEQKMDKGESEGILKKRAIEDSIAYVSLHTYDGEYEIHTESEGVNAKLQLSYKNNRTFGYQWTFLVSNEEVNCKGELKGVLTMDRTQHGLDSQGECFVHFNFNGLQNGRYAVEIDFEDETKCKMVSGPCTFSGTYLKN